MAPRRGGTRWKVIAGGAAIVVAAVLALALRSDGGRTVSAGKSTATTAAGRAGAGAAAGANGAVDAGQAPAGRAAAGVHTQPSLVAGYSATGSSEVPLTVDAANTTGLRDGDTVALHVVPKQGSFLYGFEGWLCRGDASYRTDADLRPLDEGKCVTRPLSPNSQDYIDIRVGPPYGATDATFKVGVGSDSYKTTDGRAVTITCGPGNPCALVLKLQYPNGYGFDTIPLVYR